MGCGHCMEQEERAEKIVLENQITQMQSFMAEMEHLYDGIRSVKHDMKNHTAVLQNQSLRPILQRRIMLCLCGLPGNDGTGG